MRNKNILLSPLVLLITLLNIIQHIQGQGVKCSKDNKCTQQSPCCSIDGNCGRGYQFCKAGCKEEANFRDRKCLPPTPCKKTTLRMDPKRVALEKDYKGDYVNIDFIAHGDYEFKGEELIIKMSQPGKGATFRSTRYINYGKITAVMKTSRGGGVVSSFITMSDVKDEIDFEWIGSKLEEVQTNFFYRGDKTKSHGGVHKIGNTYNEYHSYTIDWNENRIIWAVDGKIIREHKKNGREYPSTPSIFEFGIWDGGDSSEEGTRAWAGGKTNWNHEEIKKNGYYSVKIKEFSIECYGPLTSNDGDFDYDPKEGLVLKGSIKLSSDKRNGSVELGNETMFDEPLPSSKSSSVGASRIVITQTTSNGFILSLSPLLCILLIMLVRN